MLKMAESVQSSSGPSPVPESRPQLKSKPRSTSKVWKYFGLLVDENRKETNVDLPVCCLCFVQVSARWGNTSNLFAHLQKNHPEEYLQVNPTHKLSWVIRTKTQT